MIKLLWSNL